MFNLNSNHFNFFNNELPASWIAHIARDFLTCYSCSSYNSMMIQISSSVSGTVVTLLVLISKGDKFKSWRSVWEGWGIYSTCFFKAKNLSSCEAINMGKKLGKNRAKGMILTRQWPQNEGHAQTFLRYLTRNNIAQKAFVIVTNIAVACIKKPYMISFIFGFLRHAM